MRLDDHLTIETPEGVSIDLTLAGLGSRFGATAIDLLIQGALLLAIVLALTLAGSTVSADIGVFLMGVGSLAVATVILGYYLVFELLNGGRTPGKAAFGLRVATVDGRPLDLAAVTIRTLLRLVDFLPGAYAIGAIAIVTTSRNQRLGDLAANTVVIRDRREAPAITNPGTSRIREGWDTSAVTGDEMAVVRRYLSRRSSLAFDARRKLSAELADRLRPRVVGGRDLDDETFLEQLRAEKDAPEA